jgi:hypothetical protein
MRRMKIVGLCLIAVFAMSAVVSGSASAAAPEFGQCLKKAKKSLPGYADSKCTKEALELAKGSYEWIPGVKAGQNTFTTKGGAATLLTVKGETVTCTSEFSTGEYVVGGNNKEEKTTVGFAGCKSNGLTCTTEGKSPGELETEGLVGVVGFEKTPGPTGRKTDLLLHPGPASAKHFFIAFKCTEALTIEVQGKGNGENEGILVPIKNDAMKSVEILKYKQTKGVQKPVKWDPKDSGLTGFSEETFLESNFQKTGFAKSGQTVESTVTNTGGVKYELNAFV